MPYRSCKVKMTAALTVGLVSSSRFFSINFRTTDWALLEILSESKNNDDLNFSYFNNSKIKENGHTNCGAVIIYRRDTRRSKERRKIKAIQSG